MDSKFKFDQISWGRLTDGQNDGGQEFERSRDPRRPIQNGIMKKSYDLRLQGQREIPRFRWQGHHENIDQNCQIMNWASRAEDARESRDTWSVVRARPNIKIQTKIQFPSEEEDLDMTIFHLRLFKDLGYTDFEIAFGYCNQSQELMALLRHTPSRQRTNLEEFFNVLRERRPVDFNKVIREFFNKRQGHKEDEGALMAFLIRKYYLMHGELAGQEVRPILREGEKLLLRHQFLTALKDKSIKMELQVSEVTFEDLPSKARDMRKAQEAFDFIEQEATREEQARSSFLSTEDKESRMFKVGNHHMKNDQGHLSFFSVEKTKDGPRTCMTKENLQKKHQSFKTAPETRVAKFKVFNLGKLKNLSRIPSTFNPEPEFIYEPGKPEGYIMFQDGYCAHSIIMNMKNPFQRRAVGKIQFWPLKGLQALKVAEKFAVKSFK